MNIRAAVVDEFMRVTRDHVKELPPLTDSMPLLETGLDSLCFAIIVTRLEDSLGLDPFTADDSPFPATFGEFVKCYENALSAEV
jgi:hypothetical protein